ncbi:MAG: PilN domain-containing protein [Bacillota bacterium]
MKTINLLARPRRRATLLRFLVGLMVVAVLASGAVGYYLHTAAALRTREQELEALSAELTRLRLGPERLAYLESRQKLLTERQAALAELLAAWLPSEVLSELARICPPGAMYTEVSITGRDVTLRGRARDLQEIGLLLYGLSRSTLVDTAQLVMASEDQPGVVVFEMLARLRGVGAR